MVRRRLARSRTPVLVAAVLTLAACTSAPSADGSATGTGTTSSSSSGPSSSPAAATVLKVVRAPYHLPAPVQRAVAVTDGARIVIAGGLDAAGSSTGGVFALTPSNGHLRSLGTVPQVFHDAAGALLGRNLFVFGGGVTTTSDAVQAFDLSTGRGRVAGHLPTPLSDLAAVTVDGKAYLVGGWDGTTPQATVWSKKDGRSFKKVAMLPVGVRYPAVAAVGSTLVIAGGLLANGGETAAVETVDTATGKVAKLGMLPHPVGHAMAFAMNGIVYVAGGQDDLGNPQSSVWAIDPAAGTIAKAASLPIPLSDAAVAQVPDGTATIVGGFITQTTDAVLDTRLVSATVAPTPAAAGSTDAAAPPASGPSTPYAQDLGKAGAARPFGGLLLIADRGNDRLLVVTPKGHIVWQYPSPSLPAPPFRFYFPDDAFWVHGGHAILLNEEENDVLAEIAYPSGRTLWTYGHPGAPGSANGYVHQPDDLYPYPGGGLVVADAMNCRILFFGPSGHPTRQIGRTGDCTPGLPTTVGYPNGGTPLPNGDLLISEINGSRVSRVTSSGKVVWSTTVPGLSTPSDPQVLPNGSILVVDYNHPGAVIRFSPTGKVLWYYHPTSGPGVLDHPSLAAPLPNGLVAVTDDYRHRVVLIDPKTDKIVFQYGHTDVAGTGPGYLNTPDGLDLLLPGGVIPLHVDFPSARPRQGYP
ncbi:MAG: PQQ-binding-like beta-propeller repeat protein [Planctomycetaceae bacterium]